MSKGKLCGQVAHAAIAASEMARKKKNNWWELWIDEGQRKIVLKVSSLQELIEQKEKAEQAGVPAALIQDRGLTELPPGTVTCLGIGPAPTSVVDRLTRKLPLL